MKCFKNGILWAILCPITSLLADNPIIPDQGLNDFHCRVYDGRVYAGVCVDYSRERATGFELREWRIYSSDDLVHWTHESTLDPADTYAGPTPHCWATDIETRNDKYYFYFSIGQTSTGVAVSDNPGGPYVDALGAPLLPPGLAKTLSYDPTVYIDDDPGQTPYLIWGLDKHNYKYYIARLNEDMISLAETPRAITITTVNGSDENVMGEDANWIHKHNGIYYLNTHGSHYATASNIYGPYTYVGTFFSEYHPDHGTTFVYNNQTYFIYSHPDPTWSYRNTKITYLHYFDDGTLADAPFINSTTLGVGQYDANWPKVEAEWFFGAADGLLKKEGGSRFEMRSITNNTWLHFPKLRNLEADTSLTFCVSSANASGGVIEIHQDSTNGPLLGSCVVPETGGWSTYQTVSAQLANRAGTLDLYLVFKGSGSELVRLDWFKTGSSVPVPRSFLDSAQLLPGLIQAENYDKGGEGLAYHDTDLANIGGGYRPTEGVDVGAYDGGTVVGWFHAGEWLEYTVDVEPGTYSLNLRVASPAATKLVVSLDGSNLATVQIPNTGGWNNWQTIEVSNKVLGGGTNQILRLEVPEGGPAGPNINWFEFAQTGTSDTERK